MHRTHVGGVEREEHNVNVDGVRLLVGGVTSRRRSRALPVKQIE
jgi:hypothetical protein